MSQNHSFRGQYRLDQDLKVWTEWKMRFSKKHLQLYLSRAMRRNRLGHAIFFVADTATDKESFYQMFAKLLLCKQAKYQDEIVVPCDICRDCLQISDGKHPNSEILVPEKSNEIRIDQIRGLRESLRLSSFNDRPRLIAFEDATLLTMQAANALLKSLEEPNQNQYFLLMTTSSMAIPKTLISRCQRIITSSLSEPENDIVEGNRLIDFASGLIERIQKADLRDRLAIIEEITKSPHDKLELLIEIQKQLHHKLRSKSLDEHKNERTKMLKPIESLENARSLLKSNVNLQLTLENWLLKAWPVSIPA